MNHSQHEAGSNNGNYLRFMAMVGTSTAVMFGLMYLNSYALDHVLWSETRFWMTLVMGAAMALIMLGFMRAMYRNSQKNMIIIGAAAAVFAGSLFLVRSQITVGDTDYMSAMVPHHSIAILTSERARIHDARVRALANGIIRTQRKEISEMRWLIADIEAHGIAATPEEARARPVPDFEGHLNAGDWDPSQSKMVDR
ncbi:hypothetical protein AOA14_01560 [Sphingopyxis terrae subsp. terrae NBRC 15098]|uniref:DUF305 domain-containing protein n=1 Tax=Sphingopyxis terrae subsp. terrae NBRC 15098 TaxID=1219058 RepID=A0A142VU16_9SPHN|nr:DUF305 domain-containing protein [Sphingopyxis terrae]AMU93286.1 hypothetical protein AOA14_01560 [Sphingopyxis terrae subsp. terrae NBRC 15098]